MLRGCHHGIAWLNAAEPTPPSPSQPAGRRHWAGDSHSTSAAFPELSSWGLLLVLVPELSEKTISALAGQHLNKDELLGKSSISGY